MLPRSQLTILQSKPSQFAEYLPYLQAIDKKCFRKSDRLVHLCIEELSKKSNSLFIAILNDDRASVCGYLLYSHTRLESSGRILKVSRVGSGRIETNRDMMDLFYSPFVSLSLLAIFLYFIKCSHTFYLHRHS